MEGERRRAAPRPRCRATGGAAGGVGEEIGAKWNDAVIAVDDDVPARPATVALPNRCRLQDPHAEFPGVLDQQSIELTAIHDQAALVRFLAHLRTRLPIDMHAPHPPEVRRPDRSVRAGHLQERQDARGECLSEMPAREGRTLDQPHFVAELRHARGEGAAGRAAAHHADDAHVAVRRSAIAAAPDCESRR
jgi:hypothetical protein